MKPACENHFLRTGCGIRLRLKVCINMMTIEFSLMLYSETNLFIKGKLRVFLELETIIKMFELSRQFKLLCILIAHLWYILHCIGLRGARMTSHFGLFLLIIQFGFTII